MSDNPWLSASSQHFHPSTRTVPDSFAPPAFNGTNIDADTWLAHFRRYAEYRQLADRDIIQIFPLFLKDSETDWYDTLNADMKNDLDSLLGNFKAYFGKTELDYVFADETVFTRVQRPNEKARDYISLMQKLAKRVPHLEDEILRWVILRGLRPWIKASECNRYRVTPISHCQYNYSQSNELLKQATD